MNSYVNMDLEYAGMDQSKCDLDVSMGRPVDLYDDDDSDTDSSDDDENEEDDDETTEDEEADDDLILDFMHQFNGGAQRQTLTKKEHRESSETLSETDESEPNDVGKVDDDDEVNCKEVNNNNNEFSYDSEFNPKSYRNDDFFAESPYFDAFINKEIKASAVVTEIMNDISEKTDDFAQSGLQLASSTRRLASSCKLNASDLDELKSKRMAVEPEVLDGLERLGDVLDEMASAQEHLCRYFKSFMVSRMKSITGRDKKSLDKINRMRNEAQNESDEAEQLFKKYFHSKKEAFGNPGCDTSMHNNRRGSVGVMRTRSNDGMVRPRRGSVAVMQPSFSGGRHPRPSLSVRGPNGRQQQPNKRVSMQNLSMELLQPRRKSPEHVAKSGDGSYEQATRAAEVTRWKHNLVQIRALQTKAELKRYRLATHIIHSKYQQNVEISNCANQMVSEMCAYFSHCSNLSTGLIHGTTNMKGKCEELLTVQQRRWGEREKVLDNTLTLARLNEADARKQLQKAFSTPSWTPSECSGQMYDPKEESDQLWDLPSTLAYYTGRCRPLAKGVLAEGWLYKKEAGPSSSTKPWSRSWFLVRRDGVFNLHCDTGDLSSDRKNNEDELQEDFAELSIEKVKVCDLKLCTVREALELNKDPSTRFCFELITPNNYKDRLVLQARGPHEFNRWLEAIRLGISYQLAAGADIPLRKEKRKSLTDMLGMSNILSTQPMTPSKPLPGKAEKRKSFTDLLTMRNILNAPNNNRRERMCSEIRLTVLERGRSIFGDSSENLDEPTDVDGDLSPEVRELMKTNPTCADCGEECPEWVSLNLGVLICLECSGVHRSLGVHISKVRSLTLDALSDRESRLLLSLGNAHVNKIYENGITIDSEQRKADRENWIWRKYVKKEFIGTSADFQGKSKEDVSKILYESSKKADVVAVAKAIAQGADVNWKNRDEDDKTPFEVCGVDLKDQQDGKAFECEELLYQNGATANNSTLPTNFSSFDLASAVIDEDE